MRLRSTVWTLVPRSEPPGPGASRSSVRVRSRRLDAGASTRRCRSRAQPPGCQRSPCPGPLLTRLCPLLVGAPGCWVKFRCGFLEGRRAVALPALKPQITTQFVSSLTKLGRDSCFV